MYFNNEKRSRIINWKRERIKLEYERNVLLLREGKSSMFGPLQFMQNLIRKKYPNFGRCYDRKIVEI